MRYGLIVRTAAAAAALTAAGLVHAAENEVVVVPMSYGDGVYFQRDAARILPCEPPTLPVAGGGVTPRVEGLRNSEQVFSKPLRDPRLKLVEDPTADVPSERVTATDFTLYLPWTNEYEELRFFSNQERREANVVINLADAIGTYEAAGGRDQDAPCQYPERLRAERDAIDTPARIDEGLSRAEDQQSD